MRHASRAATVLGLALGAWLSVLYIGKSSALTAAKVTIAEQKEENAARVEAAYREKRADSLKYAREVAQAVKAKREALARLDGTLTLTGMQLDSARAVLADSLATAEALRASLTTTVAKVDTLMVEVSRYKTAADSLEGAHQRERAYLVETLRGADATIAAKDAAMKSWRKAAECRILGFKCPTRTQTFVLGVVTTGALVVALR